MSVINILKKVFNLLMDFRSWRRLVWKNKTDYKLSFFTKCNYALKGFTVNEYIWYDLAHNDYREYISDYERIRSRDINSEYKIILDSKLLFDEIFRNKVSKYGASSKSEGFAELFAKVMNNDNDEITTIFKGVLDNKIRELK